MAGRHLLAGLFVIAVAPCAEGIIDYAYIETSRSAATTILAPQDTVYRGESFHDGETKTWEYASNFVDKATSEPLPDRTVRGEFIVWGSDFSFGVATASSTLRPAFTTQRSSNGIVTITVSVKMHSQGLGQNGWEPAYSESIGSAGSRCTIGMRINRLPGLRPFKLEYSWRAATNHVNPTWMSSAVADATISFDTNVIKLNPTSAQEGLIEGKFQSGPLSIALNASATGWNMGNPGLGGVTTADAYIDLLLKLTYKDIQYLYFAWGEPMPRQLKRLRDPITKKDYLAWIVGSMPASTISPVQRQEIINYTKARFAAYDIGFWNSDLPDACRIYFTPHTADLVLPDGRNLYGQYYTEVGWPDWGNTTKSDMLFVVTGLPDPSLRTSDFLGLIASHEVGHALGLRHVDPKWPCDKYDEEIMDYSGFYAPGMEQFINCMTQVFDKADLSTTHNPVYHLLKYVNGERAPAATPGSWDTSRPAPRVSAFQMPTTQFGEAQLDVVIGEGCTLGRSVSLPLALLNGSVMDLPQNVPFQIFGRKLDSTNYTLVAAPAEVTDSALPTDLGAHSIRILNVDGTAVTPIVNGTLFNALPVPFTKAEVERPQTIRLSWTPAGEGHRYLLQHGASVVGPWTLVGEPTTNTSWTVSASNSIGFFRLGAFPATQ